MRNIRKATILSIIAVALGMLGSALSARAADINIDLVRYDPHTGQQVSGVWDVTINREGNTDVWDISIKADPGSNPDALGHHVSVTFFTSQDAQVGTAVNVASVGAGGVSNDLNGLDWNTVQLDPATAHWDANGTPGSISNTGGNYFIGSITLQSGFTVASADVSVQDGNTSHIWENYGAVTPEGSSLALLLPGLVPLGIALRRRANWKSNQPDEAVTSLRDTTSRPER